MMESLSSPVSSKGQVVIPAKIRHELKVHTGDRIEFIVQNDVVIIQKGQDCVCPICKGKKLINVLECFVCAATGILAVHTSLYSEIERLVCSSISVHLISGTEGDKMEQQAAFPYVKIFSNRYPRIIVDWYQDYLQAKVIEDFYLRGDLDNEKIETEEIIKSFISEEIRASATIQFPTLKRLTEFVISLAPGY